MTYSIPLTCGTDLKLYNGAITFAKPEVLLNEAARVRVRLTTQDSGVHFEPTVGELIHPGVVKRGVYVEFFHLDSRGRRHWKTPSLIGLANDDWTADVSSDGAGNYTIEFKPF